MILKLYHFYFYGSYFLLIWAKVSLFMQYSMNITYIFLTIHIYIYIPVVTTCQFLFATKLSSDIFQGLNIYKL